MEDVNKVIGETPLVTPLPTIEVTFDAKTQAVGVRFKTNEFKNWAFVAGLLRIAADHADNQNRLQFAQAMQAQAMQQAEAEQIRRRLRGGR